MNKTTEALKLAEEALEDFFYDAKEQPELWEALAAIREALAEQDHFATSGKPMAEPDMNLNCPSVQARLATIWGYVKAEQEKQEPVAYTNKEQVNELIKESARLIGSIKDEGDQYLTAIDALRNAYRIGLKDSPVDAKAIRAEALEEAEEIAKTIGGSFSVEFLAAIRELK